MNNNRTGELIEKYRKEKGLTQHSLAKQLGVSNTAISKWEHGYNLPDIGLLEPLSKILEIDMLVLLSSENQAKEEHNPVKQKSKKTKLLKISLAILLIFLSITAINCINYFHYQNKLQEIKDQEVKVYRFYNYENDIVVNGYLILKNGKSTIIFEELKSQEKLRTASEERISSATLSVYINEDRAFDARITPEDNVYYEKNEALEVLKENIKTNQEVVNRKINDITMKISIADKGNIINKDIKLKVSTKI